MMRGQQVFNSSFNLISTQYSLFSLNVRLGQYSGNSNTSNQIS